jgi:hypothetical protein
MPFTGLADEDYVRNYAWTLSNSAGGLASNGPESENADRIRVLVGGHGSGGARQMLLRESTRYQ